MSSKKPPAKKTESKDTKTESKTKPKSSTNKKEKQTKKPVTKESQEEGKRRSLISALRRGISIKGDSPSGSIQDPMNIVITLSPAKHADIIEYIENTVPAGGRAEWVRDSIRLKMRIERGVYGLNTSGQDETQKGTEESLQTVFGQFAEVMTKVMSDLKTEQPESKPVRATASDTDRPRPPPRERVERGGPPQLKKVEVTKDKELEELKPDRPSLDDAIGAIVVVE
ncbi:MAG: hypothetical protein KGD59_05730 [Candidatus Heimdallarchaeota archaeon]|nr:hypothetical protein [Candidatus Heimdallarchaeota archaeon]MBY8994032.1 hypothetical protein [Candidatus Heimdallarchaeota archaeon]